MEFNIEPYYDDFEDNARDNNYMRILFKPGKAVQARELTQMQSILQNQIKQFGDHVFQDGSPVIGGNLTLDNKVRHIKLLETFNNVDIEIEDFDRKVVRNTAGSVQAKVLATYFPTDGVPTLIVKYLTGLEFQDGDTIKIAGTSTQAQLIASNASGQATVVSINEGVFYVDGFFVQVSDQTVVAAAYDVTANVKIGLEINDTIVDSEIDTTLLDPAQGSFNYQAPGGDRYQFNLTLSTRPLDSIIDEAQFFELMRLENGIITKQVKYPIYAELEKTLARRTFDESGDYTVRPFRASVMDGTDANNYTIIIEPGKAYVKGFEFETLGQIKIDVEKPRSAADVKSIVDVDVDTSSGNYLYVTSIVSPGQGNAFINIAAMEKVDIHCGTATQINVGLGSSTANGFIYQNTKIGTARVRDFVRDDNSTESIVDSNGVYRVYLTDVNIVPKVLRAAGSHTSNTINVASGQFMPRTNGLYSNVSLTILPIKLDAVDNVYAAFANSFNVNANASGTFTSKIAVGDIIRVGEFAKEVVRVDSGNLVVNSMFAYSMANSASNPVLVYKQSEHTQNVTGQSRTVSNSWWQANYETLELDRPFDNLGVPDSNTVFQLNFGVDDAECIVSGLAVANSLLANINVAMNVAIDSKLITGDVVLSETQDKVFIYPLPGTFVDRTSINNVDYEYDKSILNKAVSATPGVFIIGSGDLSTATIPWSGTTSSIRDNLVVIVRDKGASSTPNGAVLNLTSANVTVTSTQIDINTGDTALQAVDVIIRVKVNDAEDLIRTKTYYADSSFSVDPFTYPSSNATQNTEVSITNLGHVASLNLANGLIWLSNPTYNAVRPGDSISLFLPDVVKVNKVLMGNTTNYPDADNVEDITERFVFDYGQRDDKYDHAKLILKQGYSSPSGKLLVHVNFYHHIFSSTNKLSYFGPASYGADQYDDNLIPIYTDTNGRILYLRDCLDFRPSRPVGDTADTFNVPAFPQPDSTTELSFNYYLPRIDKLVLSKDKEFRVIKGKSAVIPSVPKDDDDAMTLYTLRLPPYVNDVQDIRTEYNENRRFTMKDISSIDKRVQKLEFFVSLNNVENLAMADKTLYEDNTEKEKYGIVGENFRNFSIADFKDRGFNCALDQGFLTPRTTTVPLAFKNKTLADMKLNKKTISLNFTETPAISQNLVSDKAVSVQPFLFGQFNGIVEMYPETDFWTDNQLKPEIITVPERVRVEHTTVIKETIIEKQPQITIEQIFPTRNVETIIIREPAVNPTPAPPDVIIVKHPDPPVVVQPEKPVEPPPPAPPPEPPPLPWEPPPPPPPPPEIIDIGTPPEVPIWIPIEPPPPEPEPVVVVTQPIRAGGGGGCVVLESFVPLIEQKLHNGNPVKQTYMLMDGMDILLANEQSLYTTLGKVMRTAIELQPCVRITTECGVSLVCSTTAPIPTLNNGVMKAPNVLDQMVGVYKNNESTWDKVISVEDVGDKFVRVIDTGDNCFWAGETETGYILHHNSRFEYDSLEFRKD